MWCKLEQVCVGFTFMCDIYEYTLYVNNYNKNENT